jgi:putative endonuclease
MTKYQRKEYFVYILTNSNNTVLYTGVTNNILRRTNEHKQENNYYQSFTKKYNVNKLVFYESYNDVRDAIAREKQIKGGSRKNKINLINLNNPEWKDLHNELNPV